jgi:very-short-patch-repair endonuclease
VRVPGDDANALDWVQFEQSGVVSWKQATAVLSPAKVRHLITTGRWERVCRGVLRTHGGAYTPEQHRWVAVLAAGDGAVLAGLAAARAGGLRGRWRSDAIDVLIPHGQSAPDLLRGLPLGLPAVRVRRTRHLPDPDRQRGRPERTTMARSVVDATQWAGTGDEAQIVLATACQQGLVTPGEVRDVLDRMPKVRRRALTLATLGDIEGGAEALSEIDLRRLCRRYRLPVPDMQERRTDATGRIRYIDAYWPKWGVQVEVDGAHHRDVRHWAADLRRQNDIWIQGERILRFAAFDLRVRPAEVAAQIRAALTAAGWRPQAAASSPR